MTHTPGPWNVGIMPDGYGWPTYRIRDMEHARGESGHAEEMSANADLIAAAPDLLEACEKAWALMWREGIPNVHMVVAWDSPITKVLRKAIAKAKGE